MPHILSAVVDGIKIAEALAQAMLNDLTSDNSLDNA